MDDVSTQNQTQVFSGGAWRVISWMPSGKLLRNTERDPINQWLADRDVRYFDPQVHPETHGREYDYFTDHQREMTARAVSNVNMYEVSPRTFGGITSLEIAADQFRWREPMVIYFSDGDPTQDAIPDHSDSGYPLFVPHGIHDSEQAMQAHYREFVKNGNNMRKYLMTFARELSSLSADFSDQAHEGDVIITPERLHAADLFRAVVEAAVQPTRVRDVHWRRQRP